MAFDLFFDSFLKAGYCFFDNLLFRIHVFYKNNIELLRYFLNITDRDDD